MTRIIFNILLELAIILAIAYFAGFWLSSAFVVGLVVGNISMFMKMNRDNKIIYKA